MRKMFGPVAFYTIMLLVSHSLRTTMAAVTDSYKPYCTSYANPPPGGWVRWSAASSWPGGVIPGIGAQAGASATIPCNKGVILDRSVSLDKLIVNGWLRVVDAGPFQVTANFVIVQGRLSIGSAATPYAGKVTFNLTNSGIPYTWTRPEGSGTVGVAAFAVIGGLVEMNGMYGNQKAWTTLTKTAVKGATSLVVKGDVSKWPVGGTIAIASTDYQWTQSETRTITKVVAGSGVTTLTLNAPLTYMHWGDPIPTGVTGVFMSESAEVGLLDRSIKIQGSLNVADPLIGGHFIVFQTSLPQKIIGVELVNMGQQGTLGRYPMHFHLCQDVKGAYVKSLSVHHTLQRCVVVHGTWNHLIDGNVAYATKGHCYFLEDGIEYGNTFSNNLGLNSEPPKRGISTSESSAIQSDNAVSTFWISNPNNTWINNVAAGSADSGFWFELPQRVLGPSASFPNANTVYPKFMPMGVFKGNIAHSNMRAGLRTYSDGYRPRKYGGNNINSNPINQVNQDIVIQDMRAYKNAMEGMFIHESDSVIVDGGIFADNRVVAIELHQVEHLIVRNAIVLGETINVGNPSDCSNTGNAYANCQPLVGCSLPVDPAQARSQGAGQTDRARPMFGILMDQSQYPSHGLTIMGYSQGAPMPQHIQNVTFGKFDNKCRVSAAITANGKGGNPLFSASHSSKQLKFVDSTPRIYMAPRNLGLLGFESPGDAGPTTASYVFRDEDGTLIGGPGGYAVANTPALLPYGSTACKALSVNYAWGCPNTCYRTVAFSLSGSSSPVFTVTRLIDGVSAQIGGYSTTFLNLLSGASYKISISPPPTAMQIWYADPEGCSGSIVIQLVAPAAKKWDGVEGVTWLSCSGSKTDPSGLIQVNAVCFGGSPLLQVVLGGKSKVVGKFMVSDGARDCTSMQCGILGAGSKWTYNDMGAKLASPGWALASSSITGWKSNFALFGYGGTQVTKLASTGEMGGVTWYFKNTFNFKWTPCMKQLLLGIIVNDGVVVYINGKEIYRNGLPAGPITPTTQAFTGQSWFTPDFTKAVLDINSAGLITGANTLAVEVHASSPSAWNIRFDMYLSATGSGCSAATMFSTSGLPMNAFQMPGSQPKMVNTLPKSTATSTATGSNRRLVGHHLGGA